MYLGIITIYFLIYAIIVNFNLYISYILTIIFYTHIIQDYLKSVYSLNVNEYVERVCADIIYIDFFVLSSKKQLNLTYIINMLLLNMKKKITKFYISLLKHYFFINNEAKQLGI